ncbi:hypothetical protein [Streptomyces sp. CRN 30]|uniref:helix-turn-helix domain-containing protein n=1 Tax=Streptomyces sp. CRN 30 TaxID=3075613 RepID=UPI002A7F1033|nr:hypothetical protein [Streptomyces sp. CRN 30]
MGSTGGPGHTGDGMTGTTGGGAGDVVDEGVVDEGVVDASVVDEGVTRGGFAGEGIAGEGIAGGGPDPRVARTPAEYVALLRRLKDGSGLTYRQLERRAAERGDVLARSTVADVLRRDGLPRAELVAALVRACGAGRDTAVWLTERERIAEGGTAGDRPDGVSAGGVEEATATEAAGRESASSAGPSGPHSEGSAGPRGATGAAVPRGGPEPVTTPVVAGATDSTRPAGEPGSRGSGDGQGSGGGRDAGGGRGAGRGRARGVVLAAVAALGAVALLAAGGYLLLPEDDEEPAGGGPGPAAGVTRIRPAQAPELCLTDGEARTEDGQSKIVAVQRPCGEAVPPTTRLLKADSGLYRIQWDHPSEGKGCLTVLGEGDFRDRLEPWNDCALAGTAQLFRIERAGGTTGGGTTDGNDRPWRLRAAGSDDRCVGMRGDGDADEIGAVAVMEGCRGTGADGQLFLIGDRKD